MHFKIISRFIFYFYFFVFIFFYKNPGLKKYFTFWDRERFIEKFSVNNQVNRHLDTVAV